MRSTKRTPQPVITTERPLANSPTTRSHALKELAPARVVQLHDACIEIRDELLDSCVELSECVENLIAEPRQDPRLYDLHGSWAGERTSLLAERDTHVRMSVQACFLPVPKVGEAELNPVLFNYQCLKESAIRSRAAYDW